MGLTGGKEFHQKLTDITEGVSELRDADVTVAVPVEHFKRLSEFAFGGIVEPWVRHEAQEFAKVDVA